MKFLRFKPLVSFVFLCLFSAWSWSFVEGLTLEELLVPTPTNNFSYENLGPRARLSYEESLAKGAEALLPIFLGKELALDGVNQGRDALAGKTPGTALVNMTNVGYNVENFSKSIDLNRSMTAVKAICEAEKIQWKSVFGQCAISLDNFLLAAKALVDVKNDEAWNALREKLQALPYLNALGEKCARSQLSIIGVLVERLLLRLAAQSQAKDNINSTEDVINKLHSFLAGLNADKLSILATNLEEIKKDDISPTKLMLVFKKLALVMVTVNLALDEELRNAVRILAKNKQTSQLSKRFLFAYLTNQVNGCQAQEGIAQVGLDDFKLEIDVKYATAEEVAAFGKVLASWMLNSSVDKISQIRSLENAFVLKKLRAAFIKITMLPLLFDRQAFELNLYRPVLLDLFTKALDKKLVGTESENKTSLQGDIDNVKLKLQESFAKLKKDCDAQTGAIDRAAIIEKIKERDIRLSLLEELYQKNGGSVIELKRQIDEQKGQQDLPAALKNLLQTMLQNGEATSNGVVIPPHVIEAVPAVRLCTLEQPHVASSPTVVASAA